MKQNFKIIMDKLFAVEGGFVNDPRDPGGITNLGVTALEWAKWTRTPRKNIDVEVIRELTQAVVIPLYSAWYWDMVDGDELPGGIDAMLMHFEVNAGGVSARELQTIVGVDVDGQIGPKTLDALKNYLSLYGTQQTIWELSDRQVAYYKTLPGYTTYGKGWLSRVGAFEDLALQLGGCPTESQN